MRTSGRMAASRRRELARTAGLTGLVGAAGFPLADLLVQLLQPGADPVSDYVSQAVHGAFGAAVLAAFVVSGLGYIVLALGLHASLAPGWWRRVCVALLGVAGVLLLAAAAVPAAPDGGMDTTKGAAHIYMVVATASALTLAPVATHRAMRRQAPPAGLRLAAVGVPLVGVACGALLVAIRYASLGELEGTRGLWERIFIGAVVVWAAAISWWLLRQAGTPGVRAAHRVREAARRTLGQHDGAQRAVTPLRRWPRSRAARAARPWPPRRRRATGTPAPRSR